MSDTAPGRSILIGLGAQRAGTTWLYEQLDRHPQVHLPRPKELHYWDTVRAPREETYRLFANRRLRQFDSPKQKLKARFSAKMRERRAELVRHEKLLHANPVSHEAFLHYLNEGAGEARVVGDITPAYALLSRGTYAEILGLAEDVRFVFVMRDPVARFISGMQFGYRQEIERWDITTAAFDRLLLDAAAFDTHPATQRSRYDRTFAELEANVPRERILYLFYEDLFSEETMASVWRFLKLSPVSARYDQVVNRVREKNLATAEATRQMLRQQFQPVYDVCRERFGAAVPKAWGT